MSQPFDNRDYDVQQLAEKDAEIEQLKDELVIKEGALRERGDLCRSKDQLITELCDALEEEYGTNFGDDHLADTQKELLQRAREATK